MAFDPDTFESTVRWGGLLLKNLPVLAGPEALTFKPGDDVLLIGWDQQGKRGGEDWAIWTRPIVPGVAAAEKAIGWMTGELARQIAAEVFADRIRVGTALGEETLPGDTAAYETLPGGPVVDNVPISPTGRALVFLSAVIGSTKGPSLLTSIGGRMSFQITGATSQSPSNARSVAVIDQIGTTTDHNHQYRGRIGTTVEVTGLNPGLHTFTALYARLFDGDDIAFGDRTLGVISF